MAIPIFIVCHNIGWIVRNTIEALAGRFTNSTLIIIDEASSAPRSLAQELHAQPGQS